MQWKVEIDESGKFVRARQWDEFSLDDQADFLTAIFTGPHWKPGLGVLFDYRGLIVGKLDEGDLTVVRTIFQSSRHRLESSKLALLCDSDELFELGKHFGEMLASKLENNVFVFRDEQAAVDWLTARIQSRS
ncbi:MAG TPA: hypothetical protein VFZ49_08785 [Pyrinomonadaceae bacterium]